MKIFPVKMTDQDKSRIKKLAHKFRLPMADYMRRRALIEPKSPEELYGEVWGETGKK